MTPTTVRPKRPTLILNVPHQMAWLRNLWFLLQLNGIDYSIRNDGGGEMT